MEIKQYLENNLEEMKRSLERLVKIPSVSGEACGVYPFGKSCGEVLDEFLKICAENGFYTDNYGYYAGSADLYPKGKPALGILAHLDVVPVNEKEWTVNPFELTEKDGKLYGRGTQDDKGPLIAALFAMKAVRECGYSLKNNVRLIAGCSEETGSETDIKEYCKRAEMPPMVFTPDAEFPIITTEKGTVKLHFGGDFDCKLICSISGGTVVNAVPSEAEAVLYGQLEAALPPNISARYENGRTTLTCKGKAAHASTPKQGENALTCLLSALAGLSLPEKDSGMVGGLLQMFPHGETNAASLGLDRADRSGFTTCVLSIISFEKGSLSCKADMRFPVSLTLAQAKEQLNSAANAAGFQVFSANGNEPHSVSEDSEFVCKLLKAYSEVTGQPAFCKSIGGGTYVHNIAGGVAFGMEFEGEDNCIHGADEWVSTERLLVSAEIYAKALILLQGGQKG